MKRDGDQTGDVPGVALRWPGLARWLWYSVSGRLPISYRAWVLHDLAAPTWPLRQLAKLMVPLVPVAVVLLVVLPGPVWLRGMAVGLGSVIGLLFSFVFLNESTERRAERFGFPPGAVQAAREQRRANRSLSRAAKKFHRAPRARWFPW